jgi:hypothetical protein
VNKEFSDAWASECGVPWFYHASTPSASSTSAATAAATTVTYGAHIPAGCNHPEELLGKWQPR